MVKLPGGERFAPAIWLAVGLGLLPLACTPAAVRAEHWESYQHDVQHTGRSSASFDPADLVLSWTAPRGYATPLIVGDNVISMKNQQGVGSSTTEVSSFRLADGTVNWTYQGKFVFPSQPAYADGLVVFAAEEQASRDDNLFVLNAGTGELKYTVPLDDAFVEMPTVYRNPGTGDLVAYAASGSRIAAIKLGPSSGTTLWSGTGDFGGQSIPTIVGDSVVLAGPGQYYAFDQTTGARNHFHSGDIHGGGGTTVAFDRSRGSSTSWRPTTATPPTR